MNLLAIDTATAAAAVGVVTRNAVMAAREVAAVNHAPTLVAAIDAVLAEAKTPLSSVSGIAVGIGPGSFTGLRIGLATAKGLAFALCIPIWGVSTLAAMTRRACVPRETTVVAAVGARKGELYVTAAREGAEVFPITLMRVDDFESCLATLPPPVVRIGVGTLVPGPSAREVAEIAFDRATSLPAGDGDDVAPSYVSPIAIRAAIR